MREIRINKVLNGFVVVVVGCQAMVFTDQAVMVMFAELARYIANPAEVEKEYLQKFSPKESFSGEAIGGGQYAPQAIGYAVGRAVEGANMDAHLKSRA